MAAVKAGMLSIHRLRRSHDDSHAREITTLKTEIQQIMKGILPLYLSLSIFAFVLISDLDAVFTFFFICYCYYSGNISPGIIEFKMNHLRLYFNVALDVLTNELSSLLLLLLLFAISNSIETDLLCETRLILHSSVLSLHRYCSISNCSIGLSV